MNKNYYNHKKWYDALKADPDRYAAYLEEKRARMKKYYRARVLNNLRHTSDD